MKLIVAFNQKFPAFFFAAFFSFFFACSNLQASPDNTSEFYKEYKGIILDKVTGSTMPFASVTLIGTNISTVSNTEGEFLIKVAESNTDGKLLVSFMGFKNKTVMLTELVAEKNKIELEPITLQLPEVSVISKDAESLVQAMMDKRADNYSAEEIQMTAFYRETIKKNKTYASLSEAVVDVYKEPYESYKYDVVKMYKARKRTDYTKVDTLVFKLMGGPFNSLYLDLMKYPELIFTEDMMKNYDFRFDFSTRLDNRLIYVVDFFQNKNNEDPLYYGKLYIDAQTQALKSAVFKLNIEDKEASSKMFIIKKPLNANVYPVEASYRIDYTEKNGKWYYSYSRIELGLRINWQKKLFKTTYYSTIEMAVTDWDKADDGKPRGKERLRPTVVVSDAAAGFTDPDFWGELNVIEPEKSIETAIKKIQKQLIKKE